jgi:hypothetical protein
MAVPAEEFFLSLAVTPEGIIYLGTGHGGKVYRIAKEGQPELYFQAPEMDVTCLALDSKGVLYAGTSPNGKVYKITAKDKFEALYNPDEKYIWDLLVDESGKLVAAMGESGGIYEINSQGEGKQILKVQENHILCLKVAPNGDFIAGSSGKGSVYRLTKAGKATLLFESPYEEIRSLALDGQGNIYAAAGGTVAKGRREGVRLAPATATPTPTAEVSVTVSAARPAPETAAITPATAEKEPGALFRISSDGIAKEIWSSPEDLVYSLFWIEAEKKIFFGTGGRGRIFALDKDEKASLLLQKNSEQIYELFPQDSKFLVLSNNPPQLSTVFAEQSFSGEYLSSVLDAKMVASWGKVLWESELPAGTTLQVETRAGNSSEPGSAWSEWSPPYQKKEGEQILNPRARYLQYKVMFKTPSGRLSPELKNISLFYLQVNIAPVVRRVDLLPANDVFLKLPEADEVILGIEKRAGTAVAKKEEAKMSSVGKRVERKGLQTVLWDAGDENDDILQYTIMIKKEGEAQWRTLEENWTESLLAFDTVAFPDGNYWIKVIASDVLSNAVGKELRGEKTSSLLVIDNSSPAIKNFQALREKNELKVSFVAEDQFSYIKEVRFLIRPGEWRVIFPEDGVCDSKQESFKVSLPLPANADPLITVKVTDSYSNTGVFRQTF